MGKVLGGFKNMLRQWRINLKLKKAKKEKNKHPKAKSFMYNLLAILYAPFGYLFNFNNEKKTLSKLNIESLFKEIDIKLENINSKKNTDFKKIDQKIETLKKEVSKSQLKNKKYYQKKLEQIVVKKEKIENEINTYPMKEQKKNLDNNINIDKNVDKSNLKFRLSPFIKDMIKPKTTNPEFRKTIILVKTKVIKPIEIIKENNINFIKESNNELKQDYEILSKIEEKINKTTVYNHFYDFEKELKFLRQKVEKLKEKYKAFAGKFDKSVYIKEDHYKLLKDGKSIDTILEKIEEDFKKILLKKKEIFYEKKQSRLDDSVKKRDTVELKDEKPKKENKIDFEKIKAQELVAKNIIEQNRYLEEYYKRITKSVNPKKTLFSSLLNFSKSIVNFTVSLFPISLFKNKLLGSLVSIIMLNNSIKTMRKMVDPSLEMKYLLLEEYKNQQQMLIDIYKISNNSLMELTILKKNLISLCNNNEVKFLLEEITAIENNITKQLELLKLKDRKINKVLVKLKKSS